MLSSYSSIFTLGHKAIQDLLTVPVQVEEKIDGSQFSFAIGVDGTLYARSKGVPIDTNVPDRMFKKAVETITKLKDLLHPDWVYRCEYLQKPKHNALTYERTPIDHLIIFDIEIGPCNFLPADQRLEEARRVGLECVPVLGIHDPNALSLEDVKGYLERVSVLGGPKIEGVVIKPIYYDLFGVDKKVLMGKYVSEAFKEVHRQEWKIGKPKSDIVERLALEYGTPARWQKAVQHLKEAGQLENSPRDIGLLIKEVPADILKECEAEIRDKVFEYVWAALRKQVIKGLPEWYKNSLMEKQFNAKDSAS